MIAHFPSLAIAREFCAAACLGLCVAMRPFAALSGGEQSRALLARVLEAAAASNGKGNASKKPLVLSPLRAN